MNKQKKMSEVWTDIKRKRNNLSPRMKKMLKEIEERGLVPWKEYFSYRDGLTVNALMNRCLIHRTSDYEHYELSKFTDEDVQKYINLHKELEEEENDSA